MHFRLSARRLAKFLLQFSIHVDTLVAKNALLNGFIISVAADLDSGLYSRVPGSGRSGQLIGVMPSK